MTKDETLALKKKKTKKFEAVRFYGSDPASSRFDRMFTNSEKEAVDYASSGIMGYALNENGVFHKHPNGLPDE